MTETVVVEEKDNHVDEIKGIVALAAFIIYLMLAIGVWGFSISGILILVSFIIALFGGIRNNEDEKGCKKDLNKIAFFSFIAWVILLVIWLISTYTFPDYSNRLIFLMFAAAISTSLEPKDMIILLGLSVLTAIFFTSGILAVIVLLATSLFIRSAREGVAIGIVMMIPLLAVGWFIGSGWGNIVEQKVDGFTTQVGATTGITQNSVENKVTTALNNTWLLFTDPNAWYEKQFVSRGNRDDSATASALEITRIEAIPKEVFLGDDFDIVYELNNKGKEPAKNVRIMAKGDEITESCGKVNGRMCNPYCQGGSASTSCSFAMRLKDVPPRDKRYETISFSAPPCPGTYAVGAKVIYDYTAYGTLGFEMISRGYYEELLKNDKIIFKDTVSTSSAGPFKVTLRTSRQQPIPDQTEDSRSENLEFQNFTLYIGLLNEHEGTAILNNLSIYVPDNFNASVGSANCKLNYSGKNRGESINGGYVHYVPADLSGEVSQDNMKYFKCDFHVNKPVEQIKTFNVKSEVNYTFTYFKQTPVTVRGNAASAGVAAPDCKKRVMVQDATAPESKTPQPKDAVLDSLAKKIATCYLTNTEGWDKSSDICANVNINLANCEDITGDSLIAHVSKYTTEVGSNIAIKKNGVYDKNAQVLSGSEIYGGTINFDGGYHIPGANLAWVNLELSTQTKEECVSTPEKTNIAPPPAPTSSKCTLTDTSTGSCPLGATSCNGSDGCVDMPPTNVCCKPNL